MSRALCLAALCFAACATTPARSPVFDDLRALEQQKNFPELVSHLKDVPASQRDAEWEGLAARAHAAVLEATPVNTAAEGEAALRTIAAQALAFPSLPQSTPWLAARADLGVKAFKWTYSNYRHASSDEKWVPQVKAFAQADATTPGLVQRLAKELVLGRLVPSSAFPLYQLAFERDGDAVCADEKLPAVVMDVIEYHAWLDEMRALVTGRCAAQLQKPVFEKAKSGEPRAFQVGVCKMLAGQVPAELTQACE